ncbi:hypothetical protein [Labilibaculum sp.]|uniref:hypothetical protein n=1 Tax=Labilibaculum sp. TaxID=2060723 RepID=UPI002AA7B01B|nr:hypothetical protein [Labilibaculum sp.]
MEGHNYFIEAVDEKELVDFSTGKGKYFISDREFGGHWILGSWLNFILPLLETRSIETKEHLKSMFKELMIYPEIELIEKSEILLYHLHIYYYLRKENRIQGVDFLDILVSDISHTLDEAKIFCVKYNKLDTLAQIKSSINLIQGNGGLLAYDLS